MAWFAIPTAEQGRVTVVEMWMVVGGRAAAAGAGVVPGAATGATGAGEAAADPGTAGADVTAGAPGAAAADVASWTGEPGAEEADEAPGATKGAAGEPLWLEGVEAGVGTRVMVVGTAVTMAG